MPVNKLNDDNVSELNGEPCIIDFYADWCNPCKTMALLLEESAKDHADIKFFKIDIEESPKATQTYKVGSLPTLLFMKDGQICDKAVGTLTKKQLEEKISKICA